jgi:hypothetical protein
MIVPWPWNNRGEAGGRKSLGVLSAANRWKSEPQCPTPARKAGSPTGITLN